MNKILRLDKCLPHRLSIKSVDSHLYRIGLLLDYEKSSFKRNLFHSPTLVFIIILSAWLRSLIFAFRSDNDYDLSKYWGDAPHMLNIGSHFNITLCLYFTSPLISQLIYLYNFRNGVDPTFLRVFQMISGLISPKSLGLTHRKKILSLIRRTDILFKIIGINTKALIPAMAFIFNITAYMIRGYPPRDLIIYGIPNSLMFQMMAYNAVNIQIYQMLYFHILCNYLKIKIEMFSQDLLINNSKISNIDLDLKSINSLFLEINEYNTTFWSKYLLSLWLTFGSLNVIITYLVLFATLSPIIRFIFSYCLIFFITLFLIVIFNASSVNYESNKFFKILTNVMISYFVANKWKSIRRKFVKRPVTTQLQVKLSIKKLNLDTL